MAGALHKSMVWMGLREDDPRYAESRDLDVDTWDEGEDEEVVDDSEYRAEVTPITRDRSVSPLHPGSRGGPAPHHHHPPPHLQRGQGHR
ncbi:MAG: hypothetical protein PGN11_20305 [Quadrisphaera sp.]